MVTIEDHKISPSKKVIDNLDIQIIYIPLVSRMGYAYKETVKPGDYVCIGSVLGKNPIAEIPLLSTVSGTVVGYQEKYISNGNLVKCVVIENDFKEKYVDIAGKRKNITKYSKEEFLYILKKCAILGMSGSGFPTYIKYSSDTTYKYLIVDGAECEIYASSDGARMYNNPEEILECMDAIMEIMGMEKGYIAINEKRTDIINRFLRHINSYPNIKIYPLVDGYPTGYERYLVSEILGLSYDKYPTEIGVVNENVSTIYAIYDALKNGKPLTERYVTISGNGINKPANYKLKIGTNFNEVLQKADLYKKVKDPILIAGGAMMGTPIKSDDLIITADTNCILIMENKEYKTNPCIKCGKCSEVCPVNLIPSLIMDNPKKAHDLKLYKCMNCGLCSYICPSKIEVRERLKDIKEDMKNGI